MKKATIGQKNFKLFFDKYKQYLMLSKIENKYSKAANLETEKYPVGLKFSIFIEKK